MTATATEPAWSALTDGFTFEVRATDMVAALKGVSPFASADNTLPVLCGVVADVKDGVLTLMATDRYMIATQVVATLAVAGEGKVLLPTAAVKALIADKDAKYDAWTFRVNEDAWSVETTIGAKRAYKNADYNFINWRRLLDGWKPAGKLHDRPESITFNPKLLARFTKMPGADKSYVRFQFGEPGKPCKFTAGEVTGLIVPVRGE